MCWSYSHIYFYKDLQTATLQLCQMPPSSVSIFTLHVLPPRLDRFVLFCQLLDHTPELAIERLPLWGCETIYLHHQCHDCWQRNGICLCCFTLRLLHWHQQKSTVCPGRMQLTASL